MSSVLLAFILDSHTSKGTESPKITQRPHHDLIHATDHDMTQLQIRDEPNNPGKNVSDLKALKYLKTSWTSDMSQMLGVEGQVGIELEEFRAFWFEYRFKFFIAEGLAWRLSLPSLM